jgi:hypothetical protein
MSETPEILPTPPDPTGNPFPPQPKIPCCIACGAALNAGETTCSVCGAEQPAPAPEPPPELS